MAKSKDDRVAEILSSELKKNKGLLSALLIARSEASKERRDIRNMLPSSGILGAISQHYLGKSYRYKTGKERTVGGNNITDKNIEAKFSRIDINSRITAKNTIVLPRMAADINVISKNIRKMVRISGYTPADKADQFFRYKEDRNAEYKRQYGTEKKLFPTLKEKTELEAGNQSASLGLGGFIGGIFSMLGGALSGAGSILAALVPSISGFLGLLFKSFISAGLVGVVLSQLDQSMKDKIKEFFTGILSGFFDAVKKGFEFFQEIMKDPKVVESFHKAINSMFQTIADAFKLLMSTKIGTPLGEFTLGGIITTTVIGLAAFKTALFAAEIALLRLATMGGGRNISLPGGPGNGKPNNRSTGKFKIPGGGWLGIGAAAAGALGLNYLLDNRDSNTEFQTGSGGDLQNTQTTSNNASDIAIKAGTAGLLTYGAYAGAKTALQMLSSGTASYAGKPLSDLGEVGAKRAASHTKWGRFLLFLEKKSPALFGRLATKLMTMGGLATIPIAGWIAALLSLGFAAWDAWAIYQLWKEFTNTDDEDIGKMAIAPSIVQTKSAGITSNTPTQTSTANISLQTPSSILETIRNAEASNNYDIVNLGQKGGYKAKVIPNLTDLTVEQVLRKQSNGEFNAAGAYQIIPSTLSTLLARKVVSGNDKFDKETQDKLGNYLAQEALRGAGTDPRQQQYALSKVWAAIPVPEGMELQNKKISTGKESYFEGVAGNKALTSTQNWQNILRGNVAENTKGNALVAENTKGNALDELSKTVMGALTDMKGPLMDMLSTLAPDLRQAFGDVIKGIQSAPMSPQNGEMASSWNQDLIKYLMAPHYNNQ